MLFLGDLADPVIEIDNFPTGIRPILSDVTPICDIIRKINAANLEYYVGIVPALPDAEMCRLPHLASDFYGRSNDFHYDKRPQVTTLHATWEWDVQRKSNDAALDRLVGQRQERTTAARALTAKVAGALD